MFVGGKDPLLIKGRPYSNSWDRMIQLCAKEGVKRVSSKRVSLFPFPFLAKEKDEGRMLLGDADNRISFHSLLSSLGP